MKRKKRLTKRERKAAYRLIMALKADLEANYQGALQALRSMKP